jgi:FtsP/CotA-like multicopper oxidase with cupredoxin domain
VQEAINKNRRYDPLDKKGGEPLMIKLAEAGGKKMRNGLIIFQILLFSTIGYATALAEPHTHHANPGGPGKMPIKEFTIIVEDLAIEIAPGVKTDVWAFGFEGGPVSVPGPAIRVNEGDFVRVYFKNTHRYGHTIHFHGLHTPFHSDGVPGISQEEVEPGEVFIYEFVADRPGTHMYHCHVDTINHIDMGMYGAFIVVPKEEPYRVDRDLVWFLDEWSINNKEGAEDDYNYFTINSVAWPKLDAAITGVKQGEKIRVRLINIGYVSHSIHAHGHMTVVTHRDGYPIKDPQHIDTIDIAPGQRVDFVMEAGHPGIFPIHCHIVPHVTNDGKYPGGMLTALVYEGYTPGKFAEPPDVYRKRHFPAEELDKMRR